VDLAAMDGKNSTLTARCFQEDLLSEHYFSSFFFSPLFFWILQRGLYVAT
jgi:hypothetical protein